MKGVGTITVYSTRGGNGKTITSVMLAVAAIRRGLKTVIIDADLEAPSLLHLIKPAEEGHNWIDYLEEKVDDVSLLPRKCVIEGLDVIYTLEPKVGKTFLSWKSKEWWQQALKRSMIAEHDLHAAGYDLVIIDNQSGTSLNSVNNMVLADATIMVIRPATYGAGAAENLLGEMYKVMRGMKPRIDYYLWNQVIKPVDNQEENILAEFTSKWDDKLHKQGLHLGATINFSSKLNLGLLAEEVDLIDYYPELEVPLNKLLDDILARDLSNESAQN
ncbi:MAG: ParA family protein [Candidatus Kariarchaeaceae archaeon]|jgi:cellulose biosynthesis protein BcsQ